MLIIIEGPDCVGKTTLVDAITETVGNGVDVIHLGPPKTKRPFNEYKELLHSIDGPTILDRSFYGECVYAPVYRSIPGLTLEQLYYLELECVRLNSVVVWCMAPREILRQRFRDRKDKSEMDHLGEARLSMVLKGFSDLLPKTHLDTVLYHTHREDPWTKAQHVLQSLPWPSETGPGPEYGIGNWRQPTAMLVGDRFTGFQDLPKPRSVEWHDTPYCDYRPFDRGGSSTYLLRALRAAGIGPYDIWLTNSVKDRLDPESSQLYLANEKKIVDPNNVVCLGEHAHRRCCETINGGTRIPHPQFWRRFHHHEFDAYAAMLRGVING